VLDVRPAFLYRFMEYQIRSMGGPEASQDKSEL
jgi:hypothetical protein